MKTNNLSDRFFSFNVGGSANFNISMFPMSSLTCLHMDSATSLLLSFENSFVMDHDIISITIESGKGKEAIKDIVDVINSTQQIAVLADNSTKKSIINNIDWDTAPTQNKGAAGTFALGGNLTVGINATVTNNLHVFGSATLSGLFQGHRRPVIRQADFVSNARTLTVAESGALVLLDTQAATVVTLPAITASDIGVTYTITQTIASNDDRVVNTAYDNDYYTGAVVLLPAAVWQPDAVQDGLDMFSRTASDSKQITFDDDLQNGGGNVGSSITVTAILAGNVADAGSSKHVWSITGAMGSGDPNSSGGSVFS